MAPEEEFIDVIKRFGHRIDFINYQGGCGGEYVSLAVASLSSEYKCQDDIPQPNHFVDYNRWQYKDLIFGGFFLSMSKHLRERKEPVSLNELADLWVKFGTGQDIFYKDAIEYFNNYDRLLIRSHGIFAGFVEIFSKSRKLSIAVKTPEWLPYLKLNVFIKLYKIKTPKKHALFEFEKVSKYRNLIPYEDYEDILNKIPGSFMCNFYHISYIDPWALGYKGTYEEAREQASELTHSIDELPNLPAFNILTKFSNQSHQRLENKLQKHIKSKSNFYDEGQTMCCIKDIIYSDVISKTFNIDDELFKEKIYTWHNKNIELINNIEIDYGVLLLNDSWDDVTRTF